MSDDVDLIDARAKMRASEQTEKSGDNSDMRDYGAANIHSVFDILNRQRRLSPYFDFGFKRILDIVGSALLLTLISPIILTCWVLIRRDGGPGFYGQPRVGRGGRTFMCWKLRSMCVNAEARLAEHIATDPVAAAEWAVSQKLKRDPRITAVGRFIRKYSMDELPQIWNVFRGEMSFVGPRPFMPSQEELYQGDTAGYYAMRPGITGLWQVSSRNESSFAERVDYDARYAREISLLTDIRICLSTVRVVLRGTGH